MRKVFVDKVPKEFTQDTLYEHFRKYGAIEVSQILFSFSFMQEAETEQKAKSGCSGMKFEKFLTSTILTFPLIIRK